MSLIYERVSKLDSWARAALAQSDIHPPANTPPVETYGSEFVTANSIRAISRIKLSRSVHIQSSG